MQLRQKATVWEKAGFSLGDMAGNFVYQSVVLLLAFFYTDIAGLRPEVVTLIFLAVRVFDAVTDPVMGAIVDRTQTRWGKYRPYLLWLCVPYAISSVLVFTVPDLSEPGKEVYALISYAVLMMLFTATNIPYFSLGSVITADPQERVSFNSYRFVAATGGGLLVTALLVPLADYFGGDDKAMGYQTAMLMMAGLSIVLFLACFWSTTERIQIQAEKKLSLKEQLSSVIANDQWRWLGAIVLVLVTAQTIKATAAAYYIHHYVEDAKSYLSVFLSVWMIGGMLGSAVSAPLARRFCKRRLWETLCFVSAGLSLATYSISPNLLWAIVGMNFVVGFANQMMAPLIFSTMADVVDYGELTLGRRQDGLVSSFTIFSLKVGLAVGGSMVTYLLAIAGYESGGIVQSNDVAHRILVVFTLVPAVGFVAAGFLVRQLSLTSAVVKANADALQERRAVSQSRIDSGVAN